jgi:hypothetical protein
MPRAVTAPRPGEAKDFPLTVHESVAFDLRVYCSALEANWTRVINRAVRELIERDLKENDGFRQRFESLKARLLDEDRCQHGAGTLRLIDPGASPSGKVKRPGRGNSASNGARPRKHTP